MGHVEIDLAAMIAEWRSHSPLISALARAVVDSYFLKGAMLVALVIAVIARSKEPFLLAKNAFVVRASAAALVAILTGRILQTSLPLRVRPIVELFGGERRPDLTLESSFPSDHAVYLVAIATAILIANRRLGLIALGWTVIVVLLPRVILNLHYPSDVIAGGMIGALIAVAIMKAPMPRKAGQFLLTAERTAPQVVYPLAFLFAYAAATNFEDFRAAVTSFFHLI